MRIGILLTTLCLLVVFCSVSIFCALGWWIPNCPNQLDYPIRGIDVSAHQGRIDWKKVSASGIRFVYLKATEGGDFQDAYFKENFQAASDAGVVCGAYHFFSLKTPGATQARNFINTVPNTRVSLPPAIDLEFWGNSSQRPSPELFQANFRAFLDTVKKTYGREPIIYTSADFSNVYLKDFPIRQFWVRDIFLSPNMDGTKTWLFWQFSEKGKVPGVDGFIDMDVFNGTADRFDALTQEGPTP